MKKQKMSLWGVGPIFVGIIVIFSVGGVFLYYYFGQPFLALGVIKYAMLFIGLTCILLGLYLWFSSAFIIRPRIREDVLCTEGAYRLVRHPIYAGIWFFLTGIIFLFHSYILLVVPVFTYTILSLLLQREETVLLVHFGEEYVVYQEKVNAIIPFIKI